MKVIKADDHEAVLQAAKALDAARAEVKRETRSAEHKAKMNDRLKLMPIVECLRITELETVIQSGIDAFVEVGNALAEIREKQLYKHTHSSFNEYCSQRWAMHGSYAYRQINASEVIDALKVSPIGNVLPDSESQARPLTMLDNAEDQRIAWGIAVESAEGSKVTAEMVSHAVKVVQASSIASSDPEALLVAARQIRADRAREKQLKIDSKREEAGAKLTDRIRLMSDAPARFNPVNDDLLEDKRVYAEDLGEARSEVQEFVRLMADLYMVHTDCVGLVLLRCAFPDWTYDNMATFLKIDKAGVVRRMKIMKEEFPLMYEFARSKIRIGGPRDMP